MKITVKDELERLCKLVDLHDTVSFDVYDTAVLRNVLFPIDIYEIVQKKINGSGLIIQDFKKLRMRSEEAARAASAKEDISLDEIYFQLKSLAEHLDVEAIKKLELETEVEFTIANPVIKKVYDYALSKGKKLFFISDMYLPNTFIQNLLSDLGYKDFIIHVSNEVGGCKGTGSLYSYIDNLYNLRRKSWLHIGDNYLSDYKAALNFGISAYHYQSLRERVSVEDSYSLEYSIMKALQINEVETSIEVDYWERFGIQTVSSIFWGFTNWLIHNIKNSNQDNLFFLSRDGYIPFIVYERLKEVIGDLPPAQYIYASRRVYQLPNILNMSRNDALDLLTAFNPALGQRITLGEIFYNIGLKKEGYELLLANNGFKGFEEEINTEQERERVKKMLDSIFPEITEIFQKEKETLVRYLEQNGLFDFQKINVVDVGWRGSTHKAIKDLTNKEVTGYYFGTTDIVYSDIRQDVKGYAFNLGKPKKRQSLIMDNVMMFEFIFSAPHSSLIKLSDSEGCINPCFNEENEVENHLSLIIKGIIKVTESYIKYLTYINNVAEEDCLKDYFKFITAKTYEDLVQFSELTTSVGIGDSQDLQSFVTSVNLKNYRSRKRKIKLQAQKNLWKNAFIVYGTNEDLEKVGLTSRFKVFDKWNLFFQNRILRGIKQPKRAFRYVLRKLRK